jgi:uncharacterized protein YbdZ (MbtH family)
MQIYVNLNTKQWYIAMVQAGSPTGWSEPSPVDRLEALNYIEQGWDVIHLAA